MGASLNAVASESASGLRMNNNRADARIFADVNKFDSLIGKGGSTLQQMVAGSTLDGDIDEDLVKQFVGNGGSSASSTALASAQQKLEKMMGDIGSSGSASALQQIAQTIEAASSQGSPAGAPAATTEGVPVSTVGSSNSGMMHMMEEMLQLLGQALMMVQGGQTGAASAGGSSGIGATPAGAQPAAGGLATGTSPAAMPPFGLRPFISIPVPTGGASSGASASGPQVTGNVAQDAQTLMSLVGGVGTNGNTLASFAGALGKEASGQGDSAVAVWTKNIASSLGNGTYDQQGSLSAGMAAMQGKGVNPVQNNMSAILTQLQSGQSTGSILNNLNALSTELQDAGRPGMANRMSTLASGLQDGAVSKPQAEQLMQIMQMLSKLHSSEGAAPLPETSALASGMGGLGPEVSGSGMNQLEQKMTEMLEQMMEMTQMTQGGQSQAASTATASDDDDDD